MPATAERRTGPPAPPRTGGPAPRRRPPADRLAALLRRRASDLLALGGLAALLAGLLLAVALRPPARLAFSLDRPPAAVQLRGFHEVERDAATAFRWAEPRATIGVPVDAPGSYRVTLTMLDTPAVQPPRPVTIAIDGRTARTVTLDDTPRDYAVEHHVGPRRWAAEPRHAFTIALGTAPYRAPGDDRALGVIALRVAVEPVPASPPQVAPLLALPLLLLALAYGALRALGLRTVPAAALLAGAPALYAVQALTDPVDALYLAAQPLVHPVWLLGAALAHALPPLAAVAWRRRSSPTLVCTEGAARAARERPPQPRQARRARWLRGGLVTLAYVLATVAMTWPYAARLATDVPASPDSFLQIWIARWVQHALVTDPLRLYDANAFYPLEHALAFSDANIPSALLMAPVYLLTGHAVLAYNLLVLGSFVLAAGGMYALVGRLSGNRAAGFLAGLAYAFLPYRFAQLTHFHQLGHAWTPWVLLALLALLREAKDRERRTWRAALALGLLLAVQALTSVYLAFQIALAVGLALAVALSADRRLRTRRCLGRLAVAGGLALLLVVPLSLPYLRVREQYGFERSLREASFQHWSAVPSSYRATPPQNRAWGWLRPEHGEEDILFPGGLALLGAALGLAGWRRRPAPTLYLVLLADGAFLLSLGPLWQGHAGGTLSLPYRLLFDHVPFFTAMRVPARFGVLVDFAIVALAGLGAARAWAGLRRRLPAGRARPVGAALTAGLALLLLAELASIPVDLERVERGDEAAPHRWLAGQPDRGAVMEFPTSRHDFLSAARAMYWSTLHWKPLVQGYAGPSPHPRLLNSFHHDLRRPDGTVTRASYVDAQNLGALQQLGVRYLVLRRQGYAAEDWPAVIAALEQVGGEVSLAADFGASRVYLVRPAAAPSPVRLAVAAGPRAGPQARWQPVVMAETPSDGWALLSARQPLRLTVTWRDGAGRAVRRDAALLDLPPVLAPGTVYCGATACPVRSAAHLDEATGEDGLSPRLYPEAPGRYRVELAVTGDVTARETVEVEVSGP